MLVHRLIVRRRVPVVKRSGGIILFAPLTGRTMTFRPAISLATLLCLSPAGTRYSRSVRSGPLFRRGLRPVSGGNPFRVLGGPRIRHCYVHSRQASKNRHRLSQPHLHCRTMLRAAMYRTCKVSGGFAWLPGLPADRKPRLGSSSSRPSPQGIPHNGS